ncbi:hypothetical protein ABPG72_013983 [Tetrahymena utriculariae]
MNKLDQVFFQNNYFEIQYYTIIKINTYQREKNSFQQKKSERKQELQLEQIIQSLFYIQFKIKLTGLALTSQRRIFIYCQQKNTHIEQSLILNLTYQLRKFQQQ